MKNPDGSRLFFLRSCLLFAVLALLGAGLAAAAVVTAGASDNGGSVKLKKGDTLQLTLPTNGTTGYDWTLSPESTPLLKLQSHSSKRAPGGQLGAPSMATYVFAATAKGSGNLTLTYARAWEHSPAANKTFTLHVEIQ